jgi:hypothetical protein
MIESSNLTQFPDENVPLRIYLEHLVRPLAITADQLRIIAEDLAYRRASATDQMSQLIREEAENLAASMRTRKAFELVARAQGLIP